MKKQMIYQIKLQNGIIGYGIDAALQVLNKSFIGKNLFIYYLKQLDILDKFGNPKGIYRTKQLLVLYETKSGYPKVLITQAGLDYFLENGIYDLILEEDEKYCEKNGIK
jgi:hypothetical protein